MEELIRLLRIGPSWHYWAFDASIAESLLYPAALPPDIPVAVPLPLASTLVGSANPIGQGAPEIVLETSLAPEQLLAAYDQRLQAEGWELLEYLHDTYGLVPAEESQIGAIYYDEGSEHELVVQVIRDPGPPHPIYLTLRFQDDSGGTLEFDEQMARIVPLLPAPAGSGFELQGAMGAGEGFTSSAIVRTNLNLTALHEHYTAQLRARGWNESNVEEGPRRIGSEWTFTVDEVLYRSRLTVEVAGEASAYKVTIESAEMRRPDASRPDEAVEESLALLQQYRRGIKFAFLSEAARSELRGSEVLTPQAVALSLQLLERSEDEDAKRAQLRAVGAERAYELLSNVLHMPGILTSLDPASCFTPLVYQEVEGVSWLLQEVKAGLSVIQVTTTAWARWQPEISLPEDTWDRPWPIEPYPRGPGEIRDDVGTPYRPAGGTLTPRGPETVVVDGREIAFVRIAESWTFHPGTPRNATLLTLRLNPNVRVLEPTDGPLPWPTRTIQFPEREFTLDLSARRAWLEYRLTPLLSFHGHEVQL